MMKTADARQGPRLAWFGRAWLNRSARRRPLLQADVRAVFLVIGDIFAPQSPEVLIATPLAANYPVSKPVRSAPCNRSNDWVFGLLPDRPSHANIPRTCDPDAHDAHARMDFRVC